MAKLHDAFRQLTRAFIAAVLDSLRSASIDELLAAEVATGRRAAPSQRPRATRTPRAGRKASLDIGALVDRIVAYLRAHPDGVRAEHLRAQLGVEKPELTAAVTAALTSKQITRRGARRGTTYFAGGEASSPRAGGRAKRSARKAPTMKKSSASRESAPTPETKARAGREPSRGTTQKPSAKPQPKPAANGAPSPREDAFTASVTAPAVVAPPAQRTEAVPAAALGARKK